MAITVRNISKGFGTFRALDDVSLEVPDGSLTALLGPSGSGKSTLLRVIAGLEQPDKGEVVIAGENMTALPPQRRNVGFVFQHYAAFKHMTVRDNVGFGLRIRKRPKAEIRAAGGRVAAPGPARGLRRALPGPALRRPAAANGTGPRPGGRAAGAAAGRALRGARRAGARGAARLAAPAARPGPRHDGAGHPRPGGGDGGRLPDRGDEPRHDRAGRHPGRAATSTRRPSS